LLKIKLPDGAVKEFPGPVTVADVAQSIGPGLAKRRLPARWTASW
jgi:threonyl-tRNA synthetase